jgi:hypothetical protein
VTAVLTIRVGDMPEVLALLRRELATIVREAAADEGGPVTDFARRIADAFEAGLPTPDAVDAALDATRPAPGRTASLQPSAAGGRLTIPAGAPAGPTRSYGLDTREGR